MLEVDRASQPLPEPGQHASARPGAQGLVERLEVVEGPGQQPRQRRPDHQMVVRAVVDLLLDPLELGLAHHRPAAVGQDPAAAGIDDKKAHASNVPSIRPHGALGSIGFAIGRLGEGPEDRLPVWHGPDGAIRLIGGQPFGREIAEMLVDPVRHERAGDPLLPPVVACMSWRHACEVFQSSRTSWSSKIIELGSVDRSQRMFGSPHDS